MLIEFASFIATAVSGSYLIGVVLKLLGEQG